MKLIYCKSCDSVVRLIKKKRYCECKKTGGVYLDDMNAIYFGKEAHPFGIDNHSFGIRIREDEDENLLYNIKNRVKYPESCIIGGEFKAFSLLREINGCSKSFKKVSDKIFKTYAD